MNGPPGTSMPAATSDHATQQLQDLATTAALSSAALAPATTNHVAAAPQALVIATEDAVADGDAELEDENDEENPVTDARRNWSHDVTLKLVKIWKRVCESHPDAGRVARMQIVYDEFKEAVDCSNRSRKAVEDKLYSVKQMYQFIIKTSSSLYKPTQTDSNGTGKPAWFELSKDERRVVRSLHRIKIPNISLEVFNVLDSVLNPKPAQAAPTASGIGSEAAMSMLVQVNHTAVGESLGSGSNGTTAGSLGSVSTPTMARECGDVVDNKRNWSNEVTLQLARAWHNAVRDNKDLRGAMLSQRVYNEFLNVVGTCSRSRKAIEDKMHSMKDMYRFIRLYNAGCVNGSGKTLWFELSKPDRRQIRNAHKIRVPNLTPEVYAELDAFMSQPGDTVADSFPEGFSRLLAAQQNLSMSATPTLSPAVSSASTATGSEQPTTVVSQLNAALTTTYEVMRRLAEEENQLVPTPLQITHPPQTVLANDPSQFVALSAAMSAEPPAKRQRSSATSPPTSISTDQRLQELLALQQHAIAERRQQHAEQMVLLLEIVGLLRQQAASAEPSQ